MKIQESGENYLEAILVLEHQKGLVRSVDIACHLNFSKPSVSRAVAILKQAGHLTVAPGGCISLTKTGRAIAEKVYGRHRFLTEYLISLGVDETTAAADACRLEHVISEETFHALKEHFGTVKKE